MAANYLEWPMLCGAVNGLEFLVRYQIKINIQATKKSRLVQQLFIKENWNNRA